MRKIKQVSNITERSNITYTGHISIYLNENTPLEYAKCPSCTGPIYNGMISCPDGRRGCCVAHYGFGCFDCKRVFDLDIEYETQVSPVKPLTISEKIGVGIFNPKGIKNLTVMKMENE